MKILAICPHCKLRIPRSFILKTMPHVDLSCPQCNKNIRSETKSEWLGSAIFGLPIGILVVVGMKSVLSWELVALGIIMLCAMAIVAYPYMTKFIPSQ